MPAQSPDRTGRIIAEVIRAANRDNPADAVLRGELKKQRSLSKADSARIADAVFSYYRWLGWLDQEQPLKELVRSARTFAARFAENPAQFTDEEMLARAFPTWVRTEVAVLSLWARALQMKPRLWLRARSGRGSELVARLGSCSPLGDGPLADVLEYRGLEDLFRTPEFHAGEFEVQDLSSQLVGLWCDAKPGETWWDACAGEGGKTLHLSDLMGNKGLVWASDRAEWRLKRFKLRAARAKAFNYRAVNWDGGIKLPTRATFDGVLLDAPCSGLGTWQRNPHARWTTTSDDVRELADLQRQILGRVAASVKPGGKLIYSVCTLTRAETTGVADAFDAIGGNFEPLPLENLLQRDAPPTARQWLWPQDCNGNGMFVAAWRRA